jgi:methylated-DNA-[protein]-cysteine S-methyltransferase
MPALHCLYSLNIPKEKAMRYQFKTITSPVGKLYLVGAGQKLHGVFFNPEKMQKHFANDTLARGNGPVLRKAEQQLKEYFKGKRTRFSIPLAFTGTEFQKKVWGELKRIPYGETISYRKLASNAGQKKAMRAVGSANGKNHLCIVVPCHRVIAADGTLGGFSGGLDKKRKLLAIEETVAKRQA